MWELDHKEVWALKKWCFWWGEMDDVDTIHVDIQAPLPYSHWGDTWEREGFVQTQRRFWNRQTQNPEQNRPLSLVPLQSAYVQGLRKNQGERCSQKPQDSAAVHIQSGAFRSKCERWPSEKALDQTVTTGPGKTGAWRAAVVIPRCRRWLNSLSAEGGAEVWSGEVSRASTQVSWLPRLGLNTQ